MAPILDQEEFTSYNNRLSLSLREFFIPQYSQIVQYFFVGSIFMLLENAGELWHRFSLGYLDNDSLGSVLDKSAPAFTRFLNSIGNSKLPVAFFWILIGCTVYILIWLLLNIFNNLRNDVIASSYIPNGSPKKLKFWESVIFHKFLLFSSIGLLIGYIFAGLKIASPLANIFLSSITDFSFPFKLIESVAALTAAAFLMYIFSLLLRLSANMWRLVYRNL